MILNKGEEIDNKNFTPNFEKSFGIKDETFILQILRTNTYSDPIGSICREVISNCRDSHREAGKAEIPVEVELLEDELSQSKKQLVFRDFGVGLSPERINEVYSVYGESTKRNSNQFTGGFGLGAKTPFAYTDSFQVKTVYHGLEYTYQLVIDKSEKGKIIEISKVQSDKQNQTEVIIPLQDKDVNTFTEKLIRTVRFWNPLPKFLGFENVNYYLLKKLFNHRIYNTVLYENKFGRLVEDKSYNLHKINVLVDKIIYPLNLDSLKRDFKLDRLQNNLVIEFDNGELDLSVSREQLYYSKRTITKVQRRLDNFVNMAFLEFNKEINSLTTVREKLNWYNESRNQFQGLKNNISKVKNSLYKFEDSLLLKSIEHLINHSQGYNEQKPVFQNKPKNFHTYSITVYYPRSFYNNNWWKFPVIIKSYRDKKTDAKIETLKTKYPEGFTIASKIPLPLFLKSKDHYGRTKSQYIREGKKEIHILGDYFALSKYRSVEKTKLPRVKKDNSMVDKSKKTFSGFKYNEGFLNKGKIHKNDLSKIRLTHLIISFDDLSEVTDNGLTYGQVWNQSVSWFENLVRYLDNSKNYEIVFLLRDEVKAFQQMFSDSITIENFLQGKITKKLKDDLTKYYLVKKLFDKTRLNYDLLLKREYYDSQLKVESLVLCCYEQFRNELKPIKSLNRLIKLLDKNNIDENIKFGNYESISNLLYYITGRKIFTKDLKNYKPINTNKFVLLNYIRSYEMSSLIRNNLQELTDYIKKGLGEIK